VTLFGHLLNYDVDNPLERAEAGDWWNSSWHTFLVVEPRLRDIMNSSDVESAYDLAPFYTLLVATGAGMLHAKREVLTPSHWSMFHAWLQPAVNTNYNQIKARRHECWNGTGPNPGHFEDSGMREVQYFLNTAREGKWQSSKFFKKIANQNFRTYKKEGHSWSMNPALCFPTTYHHKCNPQTGACTTEPFWCGGIHPQPRVTLRKCATNLTDLVCAQKQAEEAFRNDEVVRSIGESQDKIMRLSGGNDGAPDSENDLFLFHGRVVDPWVNEGSCASGFAYPQEPL
jgi:hypothetical protein